MKKKNRYMEYSLPTRSFMNFVETHLIEKFGRLEGQWVSLLDMLAQQYELFLQCKEKIKEDGLMITDRFGSLVKHPLLKCQTDAIIQITKLVQEFGISPKAIKNLNVENNDEDEFIKELTK